VTVEKWEPASRVIQLADGPESVVSMPENFNPGWRATVDGATLTPVRVDGWQQGWIVPAGDATDVQLQFAPERGYRALLLVGLVLSGLVLLAGLALLAVRRTGLVTPAAPWPAPMAWSRATIAVAFAFVLLVPGVVAAGAMLLATFVRRRPDRMLGVAALLVVGSAVLDNWAPAIWPQSGSDAMAAAAAGLLAGLATRPWGGDRS
jgi:arabinofuranan 3-O-arabinosyltransferase